MVQAAFGRCGGGPLCSVASRERRLASSQVHFRAYPIALARALPDGRASRRRFAAKAGISASSLCVGLQKLDADESAVRPDYFATSANIAVFR